MCFLNDTFEFLLRVQPGPSGHCPVLIRPGHTIPQKGQLSNMLKKKKKVPYITHIESSKPSRSKVKKKKKY